MIAAIVEQRCVNLRRGTVLKTLLVEASQNHGLLLIIQAASGGPQRADRRRKKTASAAPVNARSGNGKFLAGSLHPDQQAKFFHSGHQEFSLSGSGGNGRPNNMATFFERR
jgi:hypothetical protein